MIRRIAEWLDVREGEGFLAVGAFVCLFGIVAGHTILETARDALFLSRLAASQLTVVYAAVAVLTLLVARWNTRFVLRFGQRNALVFTLVIGSLVTTLLYFQHLTRPVLFLLYGWSALIGAVLTAQFWMYSAQLFTVAQGKRLFAPVASGAVSGAVVGATAAALLTPELPLRALLLASAALFFATAVFLTYLPMAGDVRADASPLAARAGFEFGLWTLLRNVRYLRELAAFTLFGTATFARHGLPVQVRGCVARAGGRARRFLRQDLRAAQCQFGARATLAHAAHLAQSGGGSGARRAPALTRAGQCVHGCFRGGTALGPIHEGGGWRAALLPATRRE